MGGLLLKSSKIFADKVPVMEVMIQRGMIKQKDMGF